ncbi:DUF6683 family protein [Vitiosangium sp. GDMCC 1.1324]|uniref:DUF6683 family protein n=1 Tax=Vitiosangium sp. (strain GDMCC 1.1324) TaxID=2138576 RepID=UPI000D3BD133|nr:DUF6683 family protein [Vitiosangium sp. GDMCC 1.1324]PTL83750.1 hypothetical protein DAT35_09755 [Vitiosangium sp. GDMCC 1.1324]
MNLDTRAILALLAVCTLLGAARPAAAQPVSPYRRYNSSLFLHDDFKLSIQKQWRASEPVAVRTTGAYPQPSSSSAESPTVSPMLLPLSVSSFRTVGNPVMPKRLAASVTELDADHRQELEEALLGLLKSYEQLLDRNDEQRLKNNLAGAFNFLFMSSYAALKNGQELSAGQQANLLEQINASIAMGLKERRLSDREKQELYESAVLSGSIIRGLYNEGRDKGRPEQLKLARELAAELLEQLMGITPDKVRVDGNAVRVD